MEGGGGLSDCGEQGVNSSRMGGKGVEKGEKGVSDMEDWGKDVGRKAVLGEGKDAREWGKKIRERVKEVR